MNAMPGILCVSANPAIDRRIVLRYFRPGEVNRAASADPAAGGKAAHVAFAATALGETVRWLAFLGGPEGEGCRQGVAARGVSTAVVEIATRTRTNLELIEESTGAITEVLEPGPVIQDAERAEFERKFEDEISRRPVVVISGSLPQGVATAWYGQLTKRAKEAGCSVLLDASGAALRDALSSRPDLIKPNREEAAALLERKIISVHDAVEAAHALRTRGPGVVILSLGADGAVAVREGFALLGTPPTVEAISTVGSGDSFLAGWAVGTVRHLGAEECLRLAIASGTANCLAESPGVIARDAVLRLAPLVKIERVPLPPR
jgi:1-phosphofructokinase family hexose kinase